MDDLDNLIQLRISTTSLVWVFQLTISGLTRNLYYDVFEGHSAEEIYELLNNGSTIYRASNNLIVMV